MRFVGLGPPHPTMKRIAMVEADQIKCMFCNSQPVIGRLEFSNSEISAQLQISLDRNSQNGHLRVVASNEQCRVGRNATVALGKPLAPVFGATP